MKKTTKKTSSTIAPMNKPKKRIFQAYVTEQTYQDAKRLITAKGITNSAFLEEALRAYLDDMTQINLLMRRLDRQNRLMGKQAQQVEYLGEMFAVFVQYWFAHTPELGDEEQPLAQVSSSKRYHHFLDQVSQQVIDGRRASPPQPDRSETDRSTSDPAE